MGADLYIKVIHDAVAKKYEPLFEKAIQRRDALPKGSKALARAQREVETYYNLLHGEGYFRDSYNATSVLEWLGLSWWTNVVPLCTEDQQLRGANLKKFRDMVANAKLRLPTSEELENRYIKLEVTGEHSLAEWHKYYVEKHAALIAFLDKAIELKTTIQCSL